MLAGIGLILLLDQTCRGQFLGLIALFRETLDQSIPGRERETQAKGFDRLARDATPGEIGHSLFAQMGVQQIAMKPGSGRFIQLHQALPDARFLRQPAIRTHGYCNPGPSAQLAHRFRKRHPLLLHQEGEHIAPLMAAEAVKDLFRGADRKGGGLFVMEWTEAFEVLPRLGEGHVAGYHVCDINSLLDLANDVLRNETVAHRRFYSCRSGDASNRATRRRTEGLETR